jgi:uncharacterized protein YxjI
MRYLIREKLFSFGDEFCTQDASGRDVYRVDGRAFMLLREKLVFEDADGRELGLLRDKFVSPRKARDTPRRSAVGHRAQGPVQPRPLPLHRGCPGPG